MQRKCAGVTLAEVLITLVVLGLFASSMLGSIAFMRSHAAYARKEAAAIQTVKSAIESARAEGRNKQLPLGTTSSSVTLGDGTPATLERTVSKVSGFRNLFDVAWTLTYKRGGNHSESITIQAQIMAPQV
jgi:prepilin-type N-terminal cleavage/methylation domain-containing protein